MENISAADARKQLAELLSRAAYGKERFVLTRHGKEMGALVHAGLEALVSWESSKRLARLGGSQPDIKPIPRRRLPKVRDIGD